MDPKRPKRKPAKKDKRAPIEEELKKRASEIGAPPSGDLPAAGGAEWGGWGGLPPA